MGVAIDINNVAKSYGSCTVIDNLSLHINPGEFFTLLGPSGCGKTTLLRMIIGFNSIDRGEIYVNDKFINNIPTNKRNMGMVFQNYAIFPHKTVRGNVAYGLKTRKIASPENKTRVDDILRITRISDYADRMPAQLSGGQQQRVALARAIVINPDILLMDEPLSNLDAKLRIEMRNAIKKIQRQMGITTVYVTHDQEEALAVSDRIAVMHDGVIQQTDNPKTIYQRPKNLFVSTFIGLSNIFPGTIFFRGGRAILAIDDACEVEMSNIGPAADGQNVLVSVRPEEFIINKDDYGIPAIVRSSVFLGVNLHYFVELATGQEIEVIQPSELGNIISDDTKIRLGVNPQKINVFDAESKHSLIRDGG